MWKPSNIIKPNNRELHTARISTGSFNIDYLSLLAFNTLIIANFFCHFDIFRNLPEYVRNNRNRQRISHLHVNVIATTQAEVQYFKVKQCDIIVYIMNIQNFISPNSQLLRFFKYYTSCLSCFRVIFWALSPKHRPIASLISGHCFLPSPLFPCSVFCYFLSDICYN